MILNDIPDHDYHRMVNQNDGLPTYEVATGQPNGPYTYDSSTQGKDVKVPPPNPNGPAFLEPSAGPSFPTPTYPSSIPRMPTTTVYNYINPHTGEHVASLLPPNHPQMICLQEGKHVRATHYGLLGVLAAVFWFPLGIGLCLLDRRVQCKRCGEIIEEGLCH